MVWNEGLFDLYIEATRTCILEFIYTLSAGVGRIRTCGSSQGLVAVWNSITEAAQVLSARVSSFNSIVVELIRFLFRVPWCLRISIRQKL